MTSRSDTVYSLLGLLSVLGPLSGYDLRRFIARSIAFFWDASFAQIYDLLRRLEVDGLVAAGRVEQETPPDKLVYSVTAAGRDALARWLDGPVGAASHREPFLLRVFFFDAVAPEDRRRLVEDQIAVHERQLTSYRQLATTIDELFSGQTLAFGIRYEELYLGWLADLGQQLGEGVAVN